MKLGFCYIAERSEPARTLRRVVEAFGRLGVRLVNPYTGRITELSDDGDQVDISEAKLVEAACLRPQLTFQLWFSSDTDVGCSFRRLSGGLVCHAYTLDGLDAEERARLVRWAIDYFREAVAEGTAFLLVIDPPGRTADVDWDSVVVQSIGLPSLLPAVFGLPASWVKHVRTPSGCSRERLGDFELLTVQPGAE
jgi:hypothetical protein